VEVIAVSPHCWWDFSWTQLDTRAGNVKSAQKSYEQETNDYVPICFPFQEVIRPSHSLCHLLNSIIIVVGVTLMQCPGTKATTAVHKTLIVGNGRLPFLLGAVITVFVDQERSNRQKADGRLDLTRRYDKCGKLMEREVKNNWLIHMKRHLVTHRLPAEGFTYIVQIDPERTQSRSRTALSHFQGHLSFLPLQILGALWSQR